MWRLLALTLLVGCVGEARKDETGGEETGAGPRIVSIRDLPLEPPAGQPSTREFQQRDVRGRVRDTGAWEIDATVFHTRLRCAEYEVGMQLGKGDEACSEIQWLTGSQFGTRETQCNSATVIHSGGGDLPLNGEVFQDANCVRVITRCTGVC